MSVGMKVSVFTLRRFLDARFPFFISNATAIRSSKLSRLIGEDLVLLFFNIKTHACPLAACRALATCVCKEVFEEKKSLY